MDEALEEIGHVSGEGGPLLLADLITVTSWRGVEEGGTDYERACDLLAEGPDREGCAIAIEGGTGVVWEMEGGGTAGVFRRGHDYVVATRIWPEDPDDTRTFRMLAEAAAANLVQIAELLIEVCGAVQRGAKGGREACFGSGEGGNIDDHGNDDW